MKTYELANAVQAYQSMRNLLTNYRSENFQSGTVVHVSYPARYVGPGIVVISCDAPPDQVAVRLENDNIWHYPITTVKPLSRKQWPTWIRRVKRGTAKLDRLIATQKAKAAKIISETEGIRKQMAQGS
jgi:hypothetical protein